MMQTTQREPPRLLSVAEAADRLNLSEAKVWKMVARKEIRSARYGGRRLIASSEVERIIALVAAGE